ncbi:hypothetical protein LIPSTDRAFT_70132 [Lipomyces starkeyi NRRL Y-11557]|uniref:Uncharacterized protein n=1 Tax=Lipomyces starkeyi NRRL Y-11557 TaxID=675824 RepID=A0A1E3Q9W3_LIPST|nr:hypothetical protein LIPSTDRAFT_70132 [Lipomyces starkeyi NRRL Y-11557]
MNSHELINTVKFLRFITLDLVPLENPSVYTLKTGLTDAGQVFNALTSQFTSNGYARPSIPGPPDVVHAGTTDVRTVGA